MGREEHWEGIYQRRSDGELSWFQAEPNLSVQLLTTYAPDRTAAVADVGGGSSSLVDRLLDLGYRDVTVLDVSSRALDRARRRLGDRAERVRWMVCDVTALSDLGPIHAWHDRAVFHFLTEQADRAAYASCLRRSLAPGGHAVLATFAPDGPETCSGLPVRRYDAHALADELGDDLELVHEAREEHVTPAGVLQPFTYAILRRRDRDDAPR